MSEFRLTPQIIDAVLSLNHSLPVDGQLPVPRTISVTVGSVNFNVPIVVAHAFIAGSGPIGYAQAFIYVSSPEYDLSPYQMHFR